LKKNISVFLVSMLIGASAFAGGYASLEYSDESNRLTGAENVNHGVVIGSKMDTVDYSIKMANSQTEIGRGSISEALEVRAKKSFGAL